MIQRERAVNLITQVSKKYSGEAWATHGKRPYTPARYEAVPSQPVWKSKFYDAFVLNHIVVLHAIDATPARWHSHLTHWLISTQPWTRPRNII